MASHKSEVIVILHSNDSIFNLSLCWLFSVFNLWLNFNGFDRMANKGSF